MAYGVLVESRIQAENIDALNHSAVAQMDVDGGAVVALAPSSKKGDDVWTATAPTGGTGILAIAYNPAGHYTEVNGKRFAGLSADDRDYTNLHGETFGTFIPKKTDEIKITIDNIESTSQSAVKAGAYLVPTAGSTKWTAQAEAPVSGLALVIEREEDIPFPAQKGSIGMDMQKAVLAYVATEA